MFLKKTILSNPIKINRLILLFLLSILIGSKLILIEYAGFPQPVWDQWDAQALNLYIPFIEHKLSFGELFSSHNEHRIFTTRILSLILLSVNGQWDPLLEMVINAILHISVLFIFLKLIAQLASSKYQIMALFCGFVLWMIPFGWDNAVSGFQSQFYFLLIFSLLSIYCLVTEIAFSITWILGLLFSVLSVLSMASGSLIFMSIIGLLILELVYTRKFTKHNFLTFSICIIFFSLSIAITPEIEGHKVLKAQSFSAFFISFLSAAAWPGIETPPLAVLIWTPCLLWLITILKNKNSLSKYDRFLFAISIWVILQAAAFAYSRGGDGTMPVSKYMDIFTIGILINALFIINLLDFYYRKHGPSTSKTSLASLWFFVIIVGIVSLTHKITFPGIKDQKYYGELQLSNLQKYIYSNDPQILFNKPFRYIPYPDADKIIYSLKNPNLRAILPAELSTTIDLKDLSLSSNFVDSGFYPFVGKYGDAPAIGSYGQNGDLTIGEYHSQYFSLPTAYLEIPFSGYLGEEGISAYIETKSGRKILIKAKSPPKEKWISIFVSNPGEPFKISIIDNSEKFWVAISSPKQMGLFSFYARSLIDRGKYLILFGLLGILLFFTFKSLKQLEID